VAVYYYVDDMDQAEIAAVLGVSRRTIGYRLDRFREQAQRILGETGVAAVAPSGVPKAEGESG
jgi:DNA-directed RNA polymerase specialized sigma24 family protein